MIQLQNIDFSLLNRFFGIPKTKIPQYANKSLEEIMELEAKEGNKKAQDYKKILSDPDKILEIFKLTNLENKFIILQSLSEQDLDSLLPYLNEEQLSLGLNFFTEEKLVELSKQLPLEELIGMMLQKFSVVDILSLMEQSAMDKFLNEPDVDRKYSEKYFESLDYKELQKIMIQSFGYEFKEKGSSEYIEYIEGLNDKDFKNFILNLERNDKINLISGIVEQEEDFLLLFKPEDIVRPMELLMKEDKIKLMSNLEAEFLIPMIQELPKDLTQIVLTQIDPKDFAEVLARDFQDILSSVVIFTKGKI